MDIYDAIHGRRDIEAFAPDCPPREVVERLIEAAVWAPNHRMTQPWRFHVLAGQGRDDLAEAIAGWVASSGAAEGIATAARSKLMRSPVSLFVTQVGSGDALRDEEDYAACWCALQNLLLAAHAEGLAAHLSTGGLLGYEATRDYLGLAEGDRVVSLVNLGYPREGAAANAGTRAEPIVRWEWR